MNRRQLILSSAALVAANLIPLPANAEEAMNMIDQFASNGEGDSCKPLTSD